MTMTCFKFCLEGKPPTKTAQQKRVTFVNKKAIFYNSKAQKIQNTQILLSLQKQWMGVYPLDKPLEMHIVFYFSRKKQKRKEPKATRPDLDNLAKALIDCFIKAGILKDDGLIYKLSLEKYYDTEERTEIIIRC